MTTLVLYSGFQIREATEPFSCLIKASMLELVRRVVGSSTPLVGCIAAERLSAFVGVTFAWVRQMLIQ